MYERYFGLREAPFNNTPNPRFFFATPEHEEALACLEYVVREAKGFAVLTGDAGTGKTLVSRLLISRLGSRASVATLHQGCSSPRELLEHLCAELGLDVESSAGRGAMLKGLRDHLVSEYAANRSVVVIVDEAQSLPIECFEQIRLVGNLDAENAKLLQVVLLGQPALHATLRSSQLRQLRQRIFRGFNLGPLSTEQTSAYIRHRLRIAGATRDDIFTDDAAERIYRFTGGLPRMINTACDNALLDAYSTDRLTIDADFMGEALERIELPVISTGSADTCTESRAERTGEVRRGVGRPARSARRDAEAARSHADWRSAPAAPPVAPANMNVESARLLAQLASRIEHIELRAGQLADIESRLTTLVRSAQTPIRSQPRRIVRMTPPPAPVVAASQENRRSLLKMASIVQGVVRHMRSLSKQIHDAKEAPPSRVIETHAPERAARRAPVGARCRGRVSPSLGLSVIAKGVGWTSSPQGDGRRSRAEPESPLPKAPCVAPPARGGVPEPDLHRDVEADLQNACRERSPAATEPLPRGARASSRDARAHAPRDDAERDPLDVLASAERLRRDVEALLPLAEPFLTAPGRLPDAGDSLVPSPSATPRDSRTPSSEAGDASLLGSLNSMIDLMQPA